MSKILFKTFDSLSIFVSYILQFNLISYLIFEDHLKSTGKDTKVSPSRFDPKGRFPEGQISGANLTATNGITISPSDLALKPDATPDKWRETFEEAPEKLRKEHIKNWNGKREIEQNVQSLDPNYVTGLIEAEGCFSVYFVRVGDSLQVKHEFSLSLDQLDRKIIKSLRSFFGVGTVKETSTDAKLVVDSNWQLWYSIIPFMDQYSLLGYKIRDYNVFKETLYIKMATTLLSSPKTRDQTKYWIAQYVYFFSQEIAQTRERKYSLADIKETLGLQKVHDIGLPIELFTQVILWTYLCGLTKFVKPNPYYVTGFCEGDGGSTVSISPTKLQHTYNVGASQKEILQMLQQYFSVGKIYKIDLSNQNPKSKPHWRLLIVPRESLRILHDKHFSKFPLLGTLNKKSHYDCLMTIVSAAEKGEHLAGSSEKRQELFDLSYSINLEGKRRAATRKAKADVIILEEKYLIELAEKEI